MNSYFVTDLISRFSIPDKSKPLPRIHNPAVTARKATLNPDQNPFYVEPDLKLIGEAKDRDFCCLISAPAAVGKTSLAKHIHSLISSRDRQVIYIPLKDEVIGNNYFTGLLSNFFPENTKKEYVEALATGRIILIFDGYDEVSITSSQIESNRRFITEVVSTLTEASSPKEFRGIPILFLFRSVFLDHGIFEEILPYSKHIQVEFFSEEKRIEFLSQYMAHAYKRENCDELIKSLLSAFQSRLHVASKEAEAFFGHAIVLKAFGDYIQNQDEKNFLKFVNKIAADGLNERISVGILSQVIETILEREVGKFSGEYLSSLEDGFIPFPVSLQEEVLGGLAVDIAMRDFTYANKSNAISIESVRNLNVSQEFSNLPPEKQREITSQYQNAIEHKIGIHPFVDVNSNQQIIFRNPIYFEYYLGQELAKRADISFYSVFNSFRSPSYFFALFFLNFCPGRDLSKFKDAFYYISNLFSASTTDPQKMLSVLYVDAENTWRVTFSSDDVAVEDFFYFNEILSIEIPSNGVIQDLEIYGPSGLVSIVGPFPDDYGNFITISDVRIECNTLEFSGNHIKFEPVFVIAEEIVFGNEISQIQSPESLEILNENCKVQMSDHVRRSYGSQLEAMLNEPLNNYDVFRKKLCRVLLYFRKHGRDEFACFDKKFNSRVLNKGKNHGAKVIAAFLESIEILSKRENFFFLDQNKLSEYGIKYIKQNQIEFSSDARKDVFSEWLNFEY